MRRKLIQEIAVALAIVIFALWSGANLVLSTIGNAQTLLTAGKPDSLVTEGLLWLFATPWYTPLVLALLVSAILIWNRSREDLEIAGIKRQLADLASKPITDRLITTQAKRNSLAMALKITFSTDVERFADKSYPDGTQQRSISVTVSNMGDGWLTSCLLNVMDIQPKPEADLPLAALTPEFDLLQPGLSKSIEVAHHNHVPGPQKPHVNLNDNIGIWFSAPGTWGGGAWMMLGDDRSYVVRLRATASECKPHEALLRIWVGEHRLLQAEFV